MVECGKNLFKPPLNNTQYLKIKSSTGYYFHTSKLVSTAYG